ncbi:MAG: hypothetical protein SH818_00750 [Saprospiraceae bacterium]|nr:hypothetical protein [Saprospiraceae bacterium]
MPDMVRITAELPAGMANRIPVGSLSQSRHPILCAAEGNKILFIGGRYSINNAYYDSTDMSWWNTINESTRVDIFVTSTMKWSTREWMGRRV